jgi:hypothetical protein
MGGSYISYSVRVWWKKSGETIMSHDKSMAVYLEETANGPATVKVGKELTLSREARNGYWLGAKTYVEVKLRAEQSERGLLLGFNMAEELADDKSIELMVKAEERMDSVIEGVREGMRSR